MGLNVYHADKVIEAGALIGGGHTVRDDEPKYGLAVVGLLHPDEVLSNATARAGDVLVLTKFLGTGIINTATKGGLAGEEAYRAAVEQMAALNKDAAACVKETGASACTDITGFGFLGRAAEMARAGKASFLIESSAVPLLPGTPEFAGMGLIPAGAYDKRRFLGKEVTLEDGIRQEVQDALYDPQTSGGLLVAVDPAKAAEMIGRMHRTGVRAARMVRQGGFCRTDIRSGFYRCVMSFLFLIRSGCRTALHGTSLMQAVFFTSLM